MNFERVCVIVLDSVGIGSLPDADQFGDDGTHTLRHICEQSPNINLNNLESLGLGNIDHLPSINPVDHPKAFHGKMAEISVGKDTMTGHWELMGLEVKVPFQVFPNGFPKELIARFEELTGRKVLGNKPASGTAIIEEFGKEQKKTGAWIVYTSADSVFQIAAHEEVIPLEELYKGCEIARKLTLEDPYVVGRVIARPFIGEAGRFERTANRRDYALTPFGKTLLEHLDKDDYDVISVGKINDIFSGVGIQQSYPTKSNSHGIQTTIELLKDSFHGLLFTNLVDFDALYGHRRDPHGYAKALEEFDQYLPAIMNQIGEKDLLVITADHGNDPTHVGTDHTREYVPILIYNPLLERVAGDIGTRNTFADLAATLAENFNVKQPDIGESFLDLLIQK
ncbi:phosphopentomutase [Oceanobacillus saliphilus]|uniref:phosphopentomutase n=1 Tax=Oceanobacillus saliphilus TaxID=2925834 RepID=UPI00201E21A1|nr:phosphopentomutase [Oceanobacillus saliphilus]